MITVKSVKALDGVFYDIKGILKIIELHKGNIINDKFIKEFNRLINNHSNEKMTQNKTELQKALIKFVNPEMDDDLFIIFKAAQNYADLPEMIRMMMPKEAEDVLLDDCRDQEYGELHFAKRILNLLENKNE